MSSSPHAIVSSFASVQSFQAYFRENDELPLPPNQTFEIQGISTLTSYSEVPETKDIVPKDALKIALRILSETLLPWAKSIQLQDVDPGKIRCSLGAGLSIVGSGRMTFKAVKGPLYSRLTDLFKMMIASSIFKVELAPNQELIVLGVTEKEWGLDQSDVAMHTLVRTRIPKGFSLKLHLESGTYSVVNDYATYGSSIQQKCLVYKSTSKWNFTLIQLSSFASTSTVFCEVIKNKVRSYS